jgi:hypothetical protein
MGNLEQYELTDFAADIKASGGPQKFPGEMERLKAAVEELSETVHIFDFSGAAENPRLGEGGIEEIATVLRSLQKEGKEIGVIVIDYAGAAVRRWLFARGEDISNMRHYLANFCNECRFKLAVPFNCPVWVLHQLNTEANKRAPSAQQHHSYASECGNFAENAWFAFVFSTKDKASNMCQLFCTKERRAKGDRPSVILKIEGNYCRMVDASGTHHADDYSKSILLKTIYNRYHGPKEPKKPAQSRPGVLDLTDY